MSDTSQDGRPLSPHLQIYRPQITSVLSAVHRLTGIALSLGLLFVTAWFMAAAHGTQWFACMAAVASHPLVAALLFCASWAMFYHACNGVRHLAWDAGWGFDLGTVTLTGWVVLAASTVLTILLWIFALA